MNIKKRIVAITEEYEDYFNVVEIEDALRLMGFTYLEMNFFRRLDPNQNVVMYAELFDDAVVLDMYVNNKKEATTTCSKPEDLITWVEDNLNKQGIENAKIIELDELDMGDDGVYPSSSVLSSSVITAKRANKFAKSNGGDRKKTSTRDFADKLLRVRSSNVWAYAFNPKTDQVGDMLMQFKGANGGPGNIYIYYDVPTKIWRRLVGAKSKGSTFWKLIRNNFTYAKLTGDKITHLPNGI